MDVVGRVGRTLLFFRVSYGLTATDQLSAPRPPIWSHLFVQLNLFYLPIAIHPFSGHFTSIFWTRVSHQPYPSHLPHLCTQGFGGGTGPA